MIDFRLFIRFLGAAIGVFALAWVVAELTGLVSHEHAPTTAHYLRLIFPLSIGICLVLPWRKLTRSLQKIIALVLAFDSLFLIYAMIRGMYRVDAGRSSLSLVPTLTIITIIVMCNCLLLFVQPQHEHETLRK